MSTSTLGLFLRHLALSKEVTRLGTTSDHDLLAAYESERGQAAFTELIRRHGPMVLRTCRRLLGRGPDAEDAFQATFVLLAHKAGQLRRESAGRQSLCGWLHRVAYHTALKILNGEIRRRAHERQASVMTHPERDPVLEATWNEIQPILDAELDALPKQARQLLIACYLQGKTHAEAAAELRLPLGSVARHLERARGLLATRLVRRGITVSSILLAVLLEEAAKGAGVPAVLLVYTVEAAMTFTGQAAGIVSNEVTRLVEGGLAQMTKGWTYWSMALAGWVSLLGVGLLACQTLKAWPDQKPNSEPPAVTAERSVQEGDKQLRTDLYGDPLPAEALVRLGTTRLRHSPAATGVCFTSDGKTVATAMATGFVRWCDVATGKRIRSLRLGGGNYFPVSGDRKAIVSCTNNQLGLWDLRTGGQLRKIELKLEKNRQVGALALSFDAKMVAFCDVASGGDDAVIRLLDVATGNQLRVLQAHRKPTHLLSFSPDNRTLALAGGDEVVQLWDVSSGKLLYKLEHPRMILTVSFSPDGKMLASAGSDHQPGPSVEQVRRQERNNVSAVRLWDVATGKLLRTLEGHQQFITAVSFSPDGKVLASASWDRTIRLWDVTAGKELRKLKCLVDFTPFSLSFSPDSKVLASVGDGAAVQLWDVMTGQEIHSSQEAHTSPVRSISFSPDGRMLATGSAGNLVGGADETVRLWDALSGKPLYKLEHPGGSHSVIISPDGKTLASGGEDLVYLWDAVSGKLRRKLESPGGSPLAFSPDGKLLAVGSDNDRFGQDSIGILRLWDVASGTQLRTLEHPQLTEFVAFSPDGKTLAVTTLGRKGRSLHLWDAVTGKELRKLDKLFASALSFSPDGKMLAVGGSSKIHLLGVPSGRELHTLQGDIGFVWSVAFSSSGQLLASSGSNDQTVRLWEVNAGLARECHQFRGHEGRVTSVAFSPDGRRLASGSCDTTALVWDVTGLAGGQTREGRLTPRELTACWQSLAGIDAARAYQAVRSLAAAPDQTVPFLAERLFQKKRPDPQQVSRLLADLDSEEFRVRSKATKELEILGEDVEPALRQALKDNPSAEVRRRIQQLLETLELTHPEGVSPRLLRGLRAVEVLEWINTPPARELLGKLVADPPREEVGQQAKAALKRLSALPNL